MTLLLPFTLTLVRRPLPAAGIYASPTAMLPANGYPKPGR